MADVFTEEEWGRIRQELSRDPVKYGLPRREYGSVVVASFNIRKLGKLQKTEDGSGRDEATMKFLADVCRRFDLVAVQEVMANMAGIRRLRALLGDEYGMVVSDVRGAFPGEPGNEERLAYLYNRRLVQRNELVTEVGTSRRKVLQTLALHHKTLFEELDADDDAAALREYHEKTLPEFEKALAEGNDVKRPSPPEFNPRVSQFMQFIRTPFGVAFEVRAHPGLERYPFVAVNAHLQFGRMSERRLEALTLVEWILGKVRDGDFANIVLLGDLNFDFNNPTSDLERILDAFEELGGFEEARGKRVHVSFPFIFGHPRPRQDHPKNEVFRTNIRLTETFDQIGIFSTDERMGVYLETTPTGHTADEQWAQPGGPDYGVFDFATLFSHVLNDGKEVDELSSAEREAFTSRFEHTVSDHMPIWFRMPLPQAEGTFPTEA